MKAGKIVKLGMACFATAILLTGCFDENENRVMKYEPGVYKGKKDTALSADQMRALRTRAHLQSGVVKPGGGGGKAPSRDVRKPMTPSVELGVLNNRARNQRGP